MDFTSIALGSFLFVLSFSAAFIIAAPMFTETYHQNVMEQVAAGAWNTTAEELEGEDIASYINTQLAEVSESEKKGLLSKSFKLLGMVIGVFTKVITMQRFFPEGAAPEGFDTLFRITFLLPFLVAVGWVLVSMLRSFIPFLSGGGPT